MALYFSDLVNLVSLFLYELFSLCCRKLTKELCGVIEDFGLVNFTTLDIQASHSVLTFRKSLGLSEGLLLRSLFTG